MRLGPGELLIILAIVFLIVGPNRIAGVMKGMGQGLAMFKKGLKEASEESEKGDAPDEKRHENHDSGGA